MSDKQAMIDKIRALMAKASDASVTEAESILFMEKALELLAKHNLQESDLQAESEVEINISETLYPVLADLSWFGSLAGQVAKMYFCKVLRRNKIEEGYKSPRFYYAFIGKEHNREIAIQMFDYLMKTMHRLASNYSKNVKDQYEFKKGCAVRLTHRVYEINEANKVSVLPEKSGLPALYNQELALVEAHMSGMKLRQANKTSIRVGNSSFYDGSNAANGISLNNQVGGNKKPNLMIK